MREQECPEKGIFPVPPLSEVKAQERDEACVQYASPSHLRRRLRIGQHIKSEEPQRPVIEAMDKNIDRVGVAVIENPRAFQRARRGKECECAIEPPGP